MKTFIKNSFLLLAAACCIFACSKSIDQLEEQVEEQIEGYIVVLKDTDSRTAPKAILEAALEKMTANSAELEMETVSEEHRAFKVNALDRASLEALSNNPNIEYVSYYNGSRSNLLFNLFNPVRTVRYVDLARYDGRWFELASYPQFFSQDCSCTTADYTPIRDGVIGVFNQCDKLGEASTASATAYSVAPFTRAKFFIFFEENPTPIPGLYWIIDLKASDENGDYDFALVSDPFRNTLFILSRTATIDTPEQQQMYDELLQTAVDQGYDLSKLRTTLQDPSCRL